MSDRDPVARFDAWLAEATRSEPNDPSAAALATVDASGGPSVRMVLIRGADARGFVFYTNEGSRKGKHLRTNPRAALCVHWKSLRRQVRIEGDVEPVTDEESDAYFASRARESQIGAWASRQSEGLESYEVLEQQVEKYRARFGDDPVPRPPYWGGFRVVPSRIEFWEDRAGRLHRREEYLRTGDGWATRLLYP